MPGFKFPAAGGGPITNRNPSNFRAFTLNFVSALAPDRSRNTTSQNQVVVCGVDNRVHVHVRDVSLLDDHLLRYSFIEAACRFLHETISKPIRRAASLQACTVSSDVSAVLMISRRCAPESRRSRSPMHRSRYTITSEKSPMDSAEVALAKIAPGFANLSKIVKSSSFISSSSGTASIIKSASRIASFTLEAVENFLISVTFDRKHCAIHWGAPSRTSAETSSKIMHAPPRKDRRPISRPSVPAPITAITSNLFSGLNIAARSRRFPRTIVQFHHAATSLFPRLAREATPPRPGCACRDGNSRSLLRHYPATASSPVSCPWGSISLPQSGTARVPRAPAHPPEENSRRDPVFVLLQQP